MTEIVVDVRPLATEVRRIRGGSDRQLTNINVIRVGNLVILVHGVGDGYEGEEYYL